MAQITPSFTTILPFVLTTIALLSPDAEATNRFVSTCGNNAWSGTAQPCLGPLGPKRTIQAAINASIDGDTIYVLTGTYTEAINLQGKSVHIVGLAGPDNVILDGNGAAHTVTCTSGEDEGTIIEGLRIVGGDSAGVGGGVLINFSSPTFLECQIVSNEAAGDGAGVSIALGAPHFESCIIAGNTSGANGGGVHIASGNPTFLNCDIFSNVASTQGGGVRIDGGSAEFTSCAINFNDAQHGGGVAVQSGTPSFASVELDYNEASSSGGGVYIGSGTTTMLNSEIAFNVVNTSGGGIALAGGMIDLDNCDILDNTVDSPFEEPTIAHGGGIRAVNATVTGEDLLIEGNHAYIGGGVSAKNATIELTDSIVRENEGSHEAGGITGENGSDLLLDHVQVLNNTALVAGGVGVVDSSLVMMGGSIKGHNCTAAAALSVYQSSVDMEVVVVEDNHSAGFVALGAVAIVGTDPVDVDFDYCYFIHNTALAGGAVYLSDGYARFDNCLFYENGALGGGAITADDFIGPATLQLRGCTLELNTATTTGGAVYVTSGVNFQAVSSTFRDNDADSTGGAIYAAPESFELSHCQFYNNIAENGAGVFLSGSSLPPAGSAITNCLFRDNVATDQGGGLYVGLDTKLAIRNSTLSDNVAATSGSGMFVADDEVSVVNSIVWGNSGIQVGGAGDVNFRYSIIPGFQNGLNCFTANPLFVNAAAGDYRLQAASPAIEAGSNVLLPQDLNDIDADGSFLELLPLDLAGQPRVQMVDKRSGGCDGLAVVDLGAYECAGVIAPVIHSADLNGDGMVNGADLGLLLAAWGSCGGGCCLADLNADGLIDGGDLGLLLAYWT